MKKYEIDFVNETVALSAAFLRKASTLGTPEYKEMIELRRTLPGFQFQKAEAAKKTANKNKNLTYQNMREYISTIAESKEAAAALLDEMKKVEALSKVQINPSMYRPGSSSSSLSASRYILIRTLKKRIQLKRLLHNERKREKVLNNAQHLKYNTVTRLRETQL